MQWDNGEPYLQVTDDVRLTPLRLSDVDDWYELFSSPAVAANTIRNPKPYVPVRNPTEARFPHSLAQAQVAALVDTARPVIARLQAGEEAVDACPFEAIRHVPTGRLIGNLHLYLSDTSVPAPAVSPYPWANETWDLGYNMNPSYTGKGVMTRAVVALLDGYVVPIMKLQHISAGARASNERSHAVLKRAGLELVYQYTRTLPAEIGGGTIQSVKYSRVF